MKLRLGVRYALVLAVSVLVYFNILAPKTAKAHSIVERIQSVNDEIKEKGLDAKKDGIKPVQLPWFNMWNNWPNWNNWNNWVNWGNFF